jgi:cytochrome o ubiquinol oxidase operon protein cyoD
MIKATFKSYIIGFISSIVLTLAAYSLVEIHISSAHETFSSSFLMFAILALATLQLVIQLLCFLHVGDEIGPRWKLVVLLSTVGIVLILIVGSIWIMNHLNYNMMASPSQMNAYIQSQDGL